MLNLDSVTACYCLMSGGIGVLSLERGVNHAFQLIGHL
jgi:hypothetical protein